MRNNRVIVSILAALLAVALRTAAAPGNPPPPAPGENQKGYLLGTNGTFFLNFPAEWSDSVKHVREKEKIFDAVLFLPQNTNEFNLMVEVIGLGGYQADMAQLKEGLRQSGESLLTNCVEKTLRLEDFKGEQAAGTYYRVTDRRVTAADWKAGDFKYLTRGIARVGPVIVTFELVSNDADKAESALLKMLRGARYVPPG